MSGLKGAYSVPFSFDIMNLDWLAKMDIFSLRFNHELFKLEYLLVEFALQGESMYDDHLAVIDIISQHFFNLVLPIIQSCSSTSSFEFNIP